MPCNVADLDEQSAVRAKQTIGMKKLLVETKPLVRGEERELIQVPLAPRSPVCDTCTLILAAFIVTTPT
jgi:hypothetical protein